MRWSVIALAAASALVTLALGEFVVRVFDLGPTFHVVFRETIVASENPSLGYELRPGAKDGRTRISSTGLRNRETPLAKPDGVFRIAAIGDSLTYGSGLLRLNGWVPRLEGLLNEGVVKIAIAPRVEIINFGVPGYHIGQVVESLRGLGLAHQPDAILYGYALNDLELISTEAMALDELRADEEERFRGSFRSATRWLSHSRLVLMAHHLATRPEDPIASPTPSDPAYTAWKKDQGIEYFRSLHSDPEARARLAGGMQKLADVAETARVPVLVVLFPLMAYPGREYPLADVHALVAAEAQRHGFGVIDLREPLARARSSRRIHYDFMHPNAFGAGVIAAALGDAPWVTDHFEFRGSGSKRQRTLTTRSN